MTPEATEARNRYRREYRKRMTEEQRQHEREYNRRWRAEHPEAVRAAQERFWIRRLEAEKKKMANIPNDYEIREGSKS